jgi:hypothetical protein
MSKKPTKKFFEKKIKAIAADFNKEERETNILIDHHTDEVWIETTHPPTARRMLTHLWGDPKVVFDEKSSSLKVKMPKSYARDSEMILKAKYRKSV